jgi:hypothetical protein
MLVEMRGIKNCRVEGSILSKPGNMASVLYVIQTL